MALPSEFAEAFDKLRSQLSQLSTSISLLKVDLERHDPLPAWPALQSSAATLGSHLTAVNSALSGHKTLLASAHAYPLPNFPGHSQELLLQQLLRKKLDPRAEEWIEESLDRKEKAVNGSAVNEDTHGPLFSPDDMQELLESAGLTSNRVVKRLLRNGRFDDDYSIVERRNGVKNVATGLNRRLGRRAGLQDEDDDEDEMAVAEDGEKDSDDDLEDDEDEDYDMDEDGKVEAVDMGANASSSSITAGIDVSRQALSLDKLLRFTSTGETGTIVK